MLSDFVQVREKLKTKCPKGHLYYVSFDNFRRGVGRCSRCAGNQRFTIEYVRDVVESSGYRLLSKKYNGVNGILEVECKNKHYWKTSYNSFTRRIGCPKCSGYHKKYFSKEEKRLALNARLKERRETDTDFYIKSNIRRSFKQAMKTYSDTGKIKSISKYPIDMPAIIEHLGSPPDNGKKYHIDHILPLKAFDHNDNEMIRMCWAPKNLQWLEASHNLVKSDRYETYDFDKYITDYE